MSTKPYISTGAERAVEATRSEQRISRVLKETTRATGNITSAHSLTEAKALDAGLKFLGSGYREIGKSGSGVFRSADGLRQFRIDSNSLAGAHAPGVPHAHFETFSTPASRFPTANNHVPVTP